MQKENRKSPEIKILGPDCYSCRKLMKETKTSLAELGIEADIKHIKALKDILRYGMPVIPGLVINNEVKSSGEIPKKEQIKKWIEEQKWLKQPILNA